MLFLPIYDLLFTFVPCLPSRCASGPLVTSLHSNVKLTSNFFSLYLDYVGVCGVKGRKEEGERKGGVGRRGNKA